MNERKGSIVIFSGARDRQGELYSVRDLFGMYPDLFSRSVVTGFAETRGLTYVRQREMKREVATMPLDVIEELIERLDTIATEAEKRADQARLHGAWMLAGYSNSRCRDCDDTLFMHGAYPDEPECRSPTCGESQCGCECSCNVFTFRDGEGPGPAVA